MACNPPLMRSPKQEEVPVLEGSNGGKYDDIMDGFQSFLGIQFDKKFGGAPILANDWECFVTRKEFSNVGGLKEDCDAVDDCDDDKMMKMEEPLEEFNKDGSKIAVKRENYLSFWEEEKTISLNLNYQEVLDAWSDGRSPWADDYSLSTSNDRFMGEVPVMEEERMRREARVLRYKEKRQSRLFSKKIRYEVRKLNAEKRPRLKGRFVKRCPDKTMTR